ncbi:MAG TPA: DinB family protein [Gemmatimonadaceae bacterium]
MDSRLAPLADLFRLNTRLLINCLDGLSEEDARGCPVPGVNSAAFVAAHLVDARHGLLGMLGRPQENPLAPALAGARGMSDVDALPRLGELVSAWRSVGLALDACLADLDASVLDRPAPRNFPIDDRSMLGVVAFLAQHDSHHVGQVALLRRALGYPAMRYSAAPVPA